MAPNDELLTDFLVESYENLDRLDQDFVALETDPTQMDKIGSIFRTIHTIKGTCGCLGLSKLEAVAHVGENLLCRLRDGQLIMDSEITTGLLRLVDAVREMLGSIEKTGAEGNGDYSAVSRELIRLNEQPMGSVRVALATAEAAAEPDAGTEAIVVSETESVANVDPVALEQVDAQHELHAIDAPAGREKTGESVACNAIRVDVGLLDKLMNLVGELVLARNQVLQYTLVQKDQTIQRTAQRLNLITTELQEGVMKTRMQPIGNLWNKFPRIVRDVATLCHKKVRIEMEGRETELDKTIIEAIKDPLTHVIRNSVDHGVENPEKRRAAGKSEEGRLFMRAFHEGGQVNIEISDDGKGIDPEAVKRKAVERGLITAEQSLRMSEREAIHLIFLPGFSTAEKITNVSGRGVGMDVVKTNVERIGGTVDVTSRVGEGTTLRIKIPLTLAIIPALVVTSGGERFAIPQVSLLELVRINEDDAGIEMINDTPLYRLRGNLLPLVYLNRELQIGRDAHAGGASNIVVLRSGDRQFGLVVDQINDTEEIVVKPLGKQLKGIHVFAGATIMGDGKVALILDVLGVAQKANVLSQNGEAAGHGSAESARQNSADRQTLLLFKLRGDQRMAIPLSVVARLEEFATSSIEDAGGNQVVQYRGQIMPLIDVAEAVADPRTRARIRREKLDHSDGETMQVVVYQHEGRKVGLKVERIVDVVDERITLERTAARPGVLGTAIIREKVTELLDVSGVVRTILNADATAVVSKEAA